MLTTTERATTVSVPANVLDEIQSLYDQGLYLQAWREGEVFGPLRRWAGPRARVLAGRLAVNLGASRLYAKLIARAWREAPHDPTTRYFYALTLAERRGILRAWKFLKSCGEVLPGADAPQQADWFALHARLTGLCRDFAAAESWLRRAAVACAERPWIWIENATLLEFQDRYDEALASAQKALKLRPWYRPGVQSAAHILQLLGRDEDALELLSDADRRLECGLLSLQRALLEMELGRHADARRSYDRYAELSPLLDKQMAAWLAARQCDAAYLDGDTVAAAAFARRVDGDTEYQKLAERLGSAAPAGQRHLLPVGFVRQHHKTCAPATLAALTRFWAMPAEHLEIAAEICYDGTPAHSERRWAAEHGWAAREFTVTWDSATALLDRDIPFTLTFVEPTFAHLQGCIGYDRVQQALLIRDPYVRNYGHYFTDPFLKRYRSTGPRGMALVPQAQAALLEGLDLPDAALYDRLFELNEALRRHDRAGARQILEDMRAAAPDHYLTWHARRVLAAYDAAPTEMLAAVEGLLRLFPDDQSLQMAKVRSLRDLVRRDERLAMLNDLSARADIDPVFQLMYAQELAGDARQDAVSERLLRSVLRKQPANAHALFTLANVWWGQRRFESALQLYRWAACLEDKDEFLVQVYFNAARSLGHAEAALVFLDDRFRRFGAQSGRPVCTLFTAYCQVEKRAEAFAALRTALELRPDDGELLLFAARVHADHGEADRAAELLQAAKNRAAHAQWLRAAAHLALLRGEHELALGHWREVAQAEPLALDAHREIAALLAETDRPAALEHLRQVCGRFPHHYGLHQLWLEWLRTEGPAACESVVRRLVEIHPADAWARRELALTLGQLGQMAEAFQEAEIALAMDPASPYSHATHGQLALAAGRRLEAQESLRQALRLSVDCDFAQNELIITCQNLAERREAFAFVRGELKRQVTQGNALLTFRELARHTLAPDEVLAHLREAHAGRPDLWHAWSALIGQLLDISSAAEALELARQATDRFPLLPALWLDLGRARQATGDADGQIEAIRRALQINRGWGVAVREMASVCRRAGRLQEARAALEDAIRLVPLDFTNHVVLADLLWEMRESVAALDYLRQALRLCPGHEWAWSKLTEWSARIGQPGAALELARELVAKRPREARSWLMLARMLSRPEDLEERLAALDKALELNPRCADAYDLKAELLTGQGRFDEALAACTAPVWDGSPPLTARGRAAWVEARRGQLGEAIRLMRAVLDDDNGYYWGWTQLAEWLRIDGSADEYLDAAEALVRLAPQDGTAHGFRGESRLRQGDRAGAKESLRHALMLMPDYRFAALLLFDLELEDGELDAAATTLAQAQKFDSDEFLRARAIELAARRNDKEEALRDLRELCLSPGAAGWPLTTAAQAMSKAEWSREAEEVFAAVLTESRVVPQVADLWIHRCLARGDWSCERRLPELLERGKVGAAALSGYLQWLGEKMLRQPLQQCLKRYPDALRKHLHCWGMAGYALASVEDYRAAADWLADYPNRPGVQAWMLANLVIALRALGDDGKAAAASRHALGLSQDNTSPYHELWLAMDAALAGNAAADETLSRFNPAGFDPTHRFLYALVSGVRDLQKCPAAERGAVFAAVRRRWCQAAIDCTPLVQDRLAVRRAYQRCVTRLARDRGGILAALWGHWRRSFPLLPNKVKPAAR